MFSLDLYKVIKDSKVDDKIDLDKVIKTICELGDIECSEESGVYDDHANLLRELNKWARNQEVGIVGPREFMIYMLDKYGISFTIPLRAEKKINSYLDSICTNLTELAKLGKLDPVIGRDKEIQACIDTMIRRTKCNPVLVGHAGVGDDEIVSYCPHSRNRSGAAEEFGGTPTTLEDNTEPSSVG